MVSGILRLISLNNHNVFPCEGSTEGGQALEHRMWAAVKLE